MKTQFRHIYVAFIAMSLSFVNLCFAQSPDFPFYSEPPDSTKQWALTKSKKWENFLKKKGNMYGVRWNELTGTPHSITGPGVMIHANIKANNVEHVTRAFLKQHEDLFDVPVSDLELVKAVTRKGRWRVAYKQLYKGIPVLFGHLKLTISNAGHVVSFGGDLYPNIDISTVPTVNETEAVGTVKSEVGFNSVEWYNGVGPS